jgi:hypothetical protein
MRRIPRDAALLCLVFAPLAQGGSAVDSAAPKAPHDEVQKMIELEDLFYDRYNQLNTIRDFDVHCGQEARVGTLLKRRYCRAVFESKAFETEGREVAQFLQKIETAPANPVAAAMAREPPAVTGGPPAPAIVAIEARRPDFKKNMMEVTSKGPELIRLLRERAELAKRYEATRRKMFGLKPPAEEKEPATAAPGMP